MLQYVVTRDSTFHSMPLPSHKGHNVAFSTPDAKRVFTTCFE